MEDVASRIVDKAMALGCQDAVADVVENRSYQIRFARNEAVISNQWRESNASVFVVHGKRGARPRREGVRGLLLEVRGRTLPCHLERRGGPRPPSEPLPLDPRPRVARVERSWDRMRLEALRVSAGEGRAEGRSDCGSSAHPEAGQGGPIHGPV